MSDRDFHHDTLTFDSRCDDDEDCGCEDECGTCHPKVRYEGWAGPAEPPTNWY